MSNRLFQNIIHQTADVLGRVVGVIDDSCIIVACSDPTRIVETMGAVRSDLVSVGDTFVADNFTYKPFGSSSHPDFAVFVSGIDDSARKDATVLSVAMNSVKQRYDEKYDKVNFIKNVLLDNILPGDIYLKARELKFNSDVNRVCMIVKITSKSDASPY